MKTFDIYRHYSLGYESIKQGFSWPAFFFGFIWCFVKRMWVIGIMLILLNTIINSTMIYMPNYVYLLVWIAYGLIMGSVGNYWRSSNLKRRGFKVVNTIKSKNGDNAISKSHQKSKENKKWKKRT